MHFSISLPGLKEVVIKRVEEVEETIRIFVEMERKTHRCPSCQSRTSRVHDYRVQKIQHLKTLNERHKFFIDAGGMFAIVVSASQRGIVLLKGINVPLLSGIKLLVLEPLKEKRLKRLGTIMERQLRPLSEGLIS